MGQAPIPGDAKTQRKATEGLDMAKISDQTKKNLRQAAGEHIVKGNPIEAQRIQRALQGAKKEPEVK